MFGQDKVNNGHMIFRNNENGVVACVATRAELYEDKEDGGMHGATKIAFMPYRRDNSGTPILRAVTLVTTQARELCAGANQHRWQDKAIAQFANTRMKDVKAQLDKLDEADKKARTRRQKSQIKRDRRAIRPSRRMQRVAM